MWNLHEPLQEIMAYSSCVNCMQVYFKHDAGMIICRGRQINVIYLYIASMLPELREEKKVIQELAKLMNNCKIITSQSRILVLFVCLFVLWGLEVYTPLQSYI